MSHYDFNRMGWQQFEQLVQAIAVAELGNGVRVFGGGRDGRREATFKGRVDFPKGSAEGTWNGYGVIQVKHLERPKSTTADWRWFLDEVRSELDKWVAKRRQLGADGRKWPKYMLFASNVSLSGTEDTGGIDQFDALMEEYRPKLELEGWFAWDYNQLRTLVENHPNVRRTYLEQIIVGDFLAELEKLLPTAAALTGRQLATHAATELTTRQWVRIGDSGFGDNSKLRLSEIGVDLPCSYHQRSAEGGRVLDTHVGRHVIPLADEVCRPSDGGTGAKGVVIVGGPGQGKSTVAQLIAHNYRVAFIEDAQPGTLGPVTNESISAIRGRLRKQEFPSPSRRRWPIFVDLAKFGTFVAGIEGPVSLLKYVADSILVAGKAVDSQALLEWISSWPCCLILDGLDEVPSARVRTRLIDAVSSFITEVSSVDADLFVIATTRPQGYREEFSEALHVTTAYLTEFTETQALDYADALIAIRSQDDPELATQVTDRLIGAVGQRLTQRLMTSPLQVTIMTALAERAVELPTTRYELFDAYYSTIYDREIGKSAAFTMLRTHRSHVDYLHEQAGLQLQIRNERPADSHNLLDRPEVGRILNRRLRGAGFDNTEAKLITDKLVGLASDRLVLLVSPHRRSHGFEVRSIQEYMAARALTEGEDALVLARMQALLPSAHWRNTWLLAAGKILETREHLGPQLVALVQAADDKTDETQVVLPGAAMAADLYFDGIALDFPALRRSVLETALKLFRDTSRNEGTQLRNLLDLALESDDSTKKLVLDTLHRTSRESTSNLATKVLSSHLQRAGPLGDQAKRTLTAGHRYSKPELRGGASRSFVLGNYVRAQDGTQPDADAAAEVIHFASILTEHKRSPYEYGAVEADGDLPETSLEIFRALDSVVVRHVLVAVVNAMRVREPDVAQYGASLLRYRFSRQVRGGDLADYRQS